MQNVASHSFFPYHLSPFPLLAGFDIRQSYAPPGEGMMNTFPYKHPFFAATFELTTMMFIQHILVSLDLKLYQVGTLF